MGAGVVRELRRHRGQPRARVLLLRDEVRVSAVDLWVPLRSPDDHGPRAYAAQLLEMLVGYGLIEDARQAGEDGFVVDDGDRRTLTPGQVLDEYGDRVIGMVSLVMEYSPLTTTHTSVPVRAAGGPVPYIPDVGDREEEYARYWPRREETK